MMMLRPIATSAAARPMIIRTKTWPTSGSGDANLFSAMMFNSAAEKMSSPAINMPTSVWRRIKP
jgi:hypothetical protein